MTAPTTGEQQRNEKGLTLREDALVEAMATTGTLAASWQLAGYLNLSSAVIALRRPKVQSALKEARIGVITGEAATEALQAMRDLLKPGAPPAVRLGAAKWVLEKAGHGSDDKDDDAVPLHEMSEAQLHRFLAKAQDVVNAGGQAPRIAVVPDNGALPE